jgi:REP element-mobilizing transposase RayT
MICHVAIRGIRKQDVYVVDADRLDFLDVLTRIAEDAQWQLLSYCLMGNHYHLVVEVPDGHLAAAMQRLNSTYAKRFNERHAYAGHLFERRYWADDLKHEERLLAAIGYVGRNPVKAGLCRTAGEWPWSSAGAAIGDKRCPPCLNVNRLWELMGPTPAAAQSRLREMYDEVAPVPGEALRDAIKRHVHEAHHGDGLSVHEVAEALQLSTSSVLKLMR